MKYRRGTHPRVAYSRRPPVESMRHKQRLLLRPGHLCRWWQSQFLLCAQYTTKDQFAATEKFELRSKAPLYVHVPGRKRRPYLSFRFGADLHTFTGSVMIATAVSIYLAVSVFHARDTAGKQVGYDRRSLRRDMFTNLSPVRMNCKETPWSAGNQKVFCYEYTCIIYYSGVYKTR